MNDKSKIYPEIYHFRSALKSLSIQVLQSVPNKLLPFHEV